MVQCVRGTLAAAVLLACGLAVAARTAVAQNAPNPPASAAPAGAAPNGVAAPGSVQPENVKAAAAPKAQLAADQRAYRAALDFKDPQTRLDALGKFVATYPDSSRATRAREQMLDILLKKFPERTSEIDAQARLVAKKSGKGLSKWNEESSVADAMADAGTKGVDLPLADKLAADANKRLQEASYASEMLATMKKYKEPAPTAAEIHDYYSKMKCGFLAALAKVYLAEGRQPEAEALLTQANALNPLFDEVLMLRGRIALTRGQNAEALDDFERAQLAGELDPPWRDKMTELYRAAHNGSDAGFVNEMDARYAQLFPEPFTPAAAKPISGGHVTLLELFTGSACPPCVGADLAVDGLLKSYSRGELVTLVFDQHVPEPDPLANPDSIARAELYRVTGTPTFVVDGKMMPPRGAARKDSQELYDKLTKVIDDEAARPSGVQLVLSAKRASGGELRAHAEVKLADAKQINDEVARKVLPDPPPPPKDAAKPAKATPAPPAGPTAAPMPPKAIAPPADPQMIVNFALVEDEVRYSGENGIRFHRMVVRSLAKDAKDGFPLKLGGTADADATFDPAAISAKWSSYLNDYQSGHTALGWSGFLSRNTAIEPHHTYIAAWVQDAATHRVLAAALTPAADDVAGLVSTR